MTNAEEKYLRDIANNLPKVYKGKPHKITKKVLGREFTKKILAGYRELAKDEKWVPQPDRKYTWQEMVPQVVDHFSLIVKHFKKGGLEEVRTYVTAAKNIAALQEAAAREAQKIADELTPKL
jgi:hypothetical protein